MILPSCLQGSKQQSSHELLQPYRTYHTYHTLQAAVAMRSGVRLWDIIVQAKVPSWQVAWIQLMRVDLIIVHEHFCFYDQVYHDIMICFDIWHQLIIFLIPIQLSSSFFAKCWARTSMAAMPWCSRHLRVAKSRADAHRWMEILDENFGWSGSLETLINPDDGNALHKVHTRWRDLFQHHPLSAERGTDCKSGEWFTMVEHGWTYFLNLERNRLNRRRNRSESVGTVATDAARWN